LLEVAEFPYLGLNPTGEAIMRRIVFSIVLFPLTLILPVELNATPLPVHLEEPFTLGPGQSAEVIAGELYFVFTGILSDSRCPLGVWCWWEGDAAAAVVGDLPGEIQIECVLHTFSEYEQFCVMGPYEVHLLEVAPYPVFGDPPIPPEDYLATFVIIDPAINVTESSWGATKALYR
jgi:hypothetical protein